MIRYSPGTDGLPGTSEAARGRRPCRRRAIAAIEFAMVAPLLGLLIVGMMELGRGVMAKTTLCNAARKSCRTGILRQYGNADIVNEVVNIMSDNGYSTTQFNPPTIGSVTITVTDPSGNVLADALDAPPGSKVAVQVSIPVTSVVWLSTYFMQPTSLESDLMVMMKQ
jgi:Flp pilus assembly protein TadG